MASGTIPAPTKYDRPRYRERGRRGPDAKDRLIFAYKRAGYSDAACAVEFNMAYQTVQFRIFRWQARRWVTHDYCVLTPDERSKVLAYERFLSPHPVTTPES